MAGARDIGRAVSRGEVLRLIAATREATRKCGGQDAAAAMTRVDRTTLGRYGQSTEQTASLNAPVDVIADLERECEEPVVTRVLADLAGYVLVPKQAPSGAAAWIERFGAMAKETGEALSRLGEGLANDGKITAEESRSLGLRREVDEAIASLTECARALEALEREGGQS